MNGREFDTFEQAEAGHPRSGEARPWLGIRFSCSGAYLRVYRHADGQRYIARCPRCGSTVVFRVGEGGSNDRFFEVRCGG